MNCQQVKELLVENLLVELPELQQLAVSEHLQHGCSNCLEYQQNLLDGIEVLLKVVPSIQLEDNLLTRFSQTQEKAMSFNAISLFQIWMTAKVSDPGLHSFPVHSRWHVSFS